MTIQINANDGKWHDSLFDVYEGELVNIKAEGKIGINLGDAGRRNIGPKGANQYAIPGDHEHDYISRAHHKYALLGRVGQSGEIFSVGTELLFLPTETGRLYFIVNDEKSHFSDNSGHFDVHLNHLASYPPAHDVEVTLTQAQHQFWVAVNNFSHHVDHSVYHNDPYTLKLKEFFGDTPHDGENTLTITASLTHAGTGHCWGQLKLQPTNTTIQPWKVGPVSFDGRGPEKRYFHKEFKFHYDSQSQEFRFYL